MTMIIAEAGVNHCGSLRRALDMVDAASDAGADAVKFQTFSADRLVTMQARKARYQGDDGETQHAMLKGLELSREDHEAIMGRCAARGITFLSSPFDEDSADLLEDMGVGLFKVGSGELTNLPLLQHVARKGRPMIVSTGMADLGEVEAAVVAIREAGDPPVTLMHCVSCYPAHADEVNLRAMETMRDAFGLPVGYSDHTVGSEACLAAVALGAVVIEKHFTLDNTLPGPDHRASAEPGEFAVLVASIRKVEAMRGDVADRTCANCAHGSEAPTLMMPDETKIIACPFVPTGDFLHETASCKKWAMRTEIKEEGHAAE